MYIWLRTELLLRLYRWLRNWHRLGLLGRGRRLLVWWPGLRLALRGAILRCGDSGSRRHLW
ncbi:MAG: hypothetical protein LUQ09_04920 [Methanomassiliicoccales archaeon]|nr:hypothetical protein [Methanomassiliicoccales archaeon]